MVRLVQFCFSLMLLGALSACVVGKDFSAVPATRSPYGPDIKVTVDIVKDAKKPRGHYVYDGELFEIRPEGFVVLRPVGKLAFIAWKIAKVDVPSLRISLKNSPPAPEDFELMRLTSRHPHGLTPDQLKTVLAGFGQTALEEVR